MKYCKCFGKKQFVYSHRLHNVTSSLHAHSKEKIMLFMLTAQSSN